MKSALSSAFVPIRIRFPLDDPAAIDSIGMCGSNSPSTSGRSGKCLGQLPVKVCWASMSAVAGAVSKLW